MTAKETTLATAVVASINSGSFSRKNVTAERVYEAEYQRSELTQRTMVSVIAAATTETLAARLRSVTHELEILVGIVAAANLKNIEQMDSHVEFVAELKAHLWAAGSLDGCALLSIAPATSERLYSVNMLREKDVFLCPLSLGYKTVRR